MSNYRRAYTSGGCFFFTVNTCHRQTVLTHTLTRKALHTAIRQTQLRYPFTIDAWVLLPDHLHCMWTLPDNDKDFSIRWSTIKRLTTQRLKNDDVINELLITQSRKTRRESSLWQRRFWEHLIRNQADYNRHIDYCYWNPVKHGLVDSVIDWKYSTFHRDVVRGLYSEGWCSNVTAEDDMNYGESYQT